VFVLLDRFKRSSLLQTFVIYGRKKFYNIDPRSPRRKLMWPPVKISELLVTTIPPSPTVRRTFSVNSTSATFRQVTALWNVFLRRWRCGRSSTFGCSWRGFI